MIAAAVKRATVAKRMKVPRSLLAARAPGVANSEVLQKVHKSWPKVEERFFRQPTTGHLIAPSATGRRLVADHYCLLAAYCWAPATGRLLRGTCYWAGALVPLAPKTSRVPTTALHALQAGRNVIAPDSVTMVQADGHKSPAHKPRAPAPPTDAPSLPPRARARRPAMRRGRASTGNRAAEGAAAEAACPCAHALVWLRSLPAPAWRAGDLQQVSKRAVGFVRLLLSHREARNQDG